MVLSSLAAPDVAAVRSSITGPQSASNGIMRRFGAAPWRMSVNDYESGEPGPTLRGEPVEAAWDARLASAMRTRGRAVHEEAVLADLLTDLTV